MNNQDNGLALEDKMIDHDHCPCGCEHPQPFEEDGKRYCGRCWFIHHVKCEMIPCVPRVNCEVEAMEVSRPEIKFSHEYAKLPGDLASPRKLFAAIRVRLEELHQDFLIYDTGNDQYKLPKRGAYILLLFDRGDGGIFPTLRSDKPGKFEYYSKNVGQLFDIRVVPSEAA